MFINRYSQRFRVICRTKNFPVICFLKIGHVTFICIEDFGLPCRLCILIICIYLYRGHIGDIIDNVLKWNILSNNNNDVQYKWGFEPHSIA